EHRRRSQLVAGLAAHAKSEAGQPAGEPRSPVGQGRRRHRGLILSRTARVAWLAAGLLAAGCTVNKAGLFGGGDTGTTSGAAGRIAVMVGGGGAGGSAGTSGTGAAVDGAAGSGTGAGGVVDTGAAGAGGTGGGATAGATRSGGPACAGGGGA